jgi:hypothetical protein
LPIAVLDSPTSQAVNNATQTNTSYTISSGTNKLLVVLVAVESDVTISSVYWNTAEQLTRVGTDETSTTYITGIFYLVNPTSTTANVTVNTSAKSVHLVIAGSFSGVHQTSPLDSNGGGSGGSTSPTASASVTASGCWGFGMVGSAQTDVAETGDMVNMGTPTTAGFYSCGSRDPTVGTGTQSLTWSQTSGEWCVKIAFFAPAAGAAQYSRYATASVGVVGSPDRLSVLNREVSGAVTCVGTTDRLATIGRAASGAVSAIGAIARTINYNRHAIGAMSLAGTITKLMHWSRSASSSVGLVGVINRFRGYFYEDWELANFNKWTGTYEADVNCHVWANNTEYPHCGTYNFKAELQATYNNVWTLAYKSVTGYNPLYIRAYNFRFDTVPDYDGEGQRLLGFGHNAHDSALAYAGIRKDSGVTKWCIVYRHNSAFYYAYGSAVQPNTNYHVAFGLYRNLSSQGWARLYVNGNLEIEVTGINHVDRVLNYAWLGFCYSDAPDATDAHMWADCIRLSTTYIDPLTATVTAAISAVGVTAKQFFASRVASAGVILSAIANAIKSGPGEFFGTASAALSMAATTSKSIIASRLASATVAVTGATKRLVTYLRYKAESVTISATTSKLTTLIRSAVGSVSITGTASRLGNFFRYVDLTVGEFLAAHFTDDFDTNKGLSMTANATAEKSLWRYAAAAISAVASPSRLITYVRKAASSLSMTGATKKLLAVIRSASSSINLAGITSGLKQFWRYATAAIGTAATSNRLVNLFRNASSSISITGATKRFRTRFRAAVGSITATAVGKGTKIIGEFFRYASAAIGMVGGSSRQVNAIRSALGSIAAVSNPKRLVVLFRSKSESISLAGATSSLKTFIRYASGAINLVANTARQTFLFRKVAQGINMVGNALRTSVLWRYASGAVSMVGAASGLKAFLRYASASISTAANTTKLVLYTRGVSGAISAVGVSARNAVLNRFSSAAVSVAGAAKASRAYFREAIASISASANTAKQIIVNRFSSASISAVGQTMRNAILTRVASASITATASTESVLRFLRKASANVSAIAATARRILVSRYAEANISTSSIPRRIINVTIKAAATMAMTGAAIGWRGMEYFRSAAASISVIATGYANKFEIYMEIILERVNKFIELLRTIKEKIVER